MHQAADNTAVYTLAVYSGAIPSASFSNFFRYRNLKILQPPQK